MYSPSFKRMINSWETLLENILGPKKHSQEYKEHVDFSSTKEARILTCSLILNDNYDAINITLGLPYIRISPDHGVGGNIVGKKIANPNSLIESIKFFNNLK